MSKRKVTVFILLLLSLAMFLTQVTGLFAEAAPEAQAAPENNVQVDVEPQSDAELIKELLEQNMGGGPCGGGKTVASC